MTKYVIDQGAASKEYKYIENLVAMDFNPTEYIKILLPPNFIQETEKYEPEDTIPDMKTAECLVKAMNPVFPYWRKYVNYDEDEIDLNVQVRKFKDKGWYQWVCFSVELARIGNDPYFSTHIRGWLKIME